MRVFDGAALTVRLPITFRRGAVVPDERGNNRGRLAGVMRAAYRRPMKAGASGVAGCGCDRLGRKSEDPGKVERG